MPSCNIEVKTTTLKLKNKVFILAAYGFWQTKLFTVYIICVVTIVLREQHRSTEGIRPGKWLGEQRSPPSDIIGASLSEPHTSESERWIFHYLPYVRRSVNAC